MGGNTWVVGNTVLQHMEEKSLRCLRNHSVRVICSTMQCTHSVTKASLRQVMQMRGDENSCFVSPSGCLNTLGIMQVSSGAIYASIAESLYIWFRLWKKRHLNLFSNQDHQKQTCLRGSSFSHEAHTRLSVNSVYTSVCRYWFRRPFFKHKCCNCIAGVRQWRWTCYWWGFDI